MKQKFLTSVFLLPALFGASIGSRPYYELAGQEALSKVNYDWQRLLGDWVLKLRPGRTGILGKTFRDGHYVAIYMRAGKSPEEMAAVVVHEVAHVVDITGGLSWAQRAEWARLRGFKPGTPWYDERGGLEAQTGSGDFADCTAWTLQGRPWNSAASSGRRPTKSSSKPS